MPPEVWVKVVLDHVKASQTFSSLMVIASIIHGSERTALQPYLQTISETIADSDICRIAEVSKDYDVYNYWSVSLQYWTWHFLLSYACVCVCVSPLYRASYFVVWSQWLVWVRKIVDRSACSFSPSYCQSWHYTDRNPLKNRCWFNWTNTISCVIFALWYTSPSI